MKIEELQLGNIVYSGGVSKYPMRVTGIYDGVVRLDFTGNEGGPWEVDPATLSPVSIDGYVLESIGFKKDEMGIYHCGKACVSLDDITIFHEDEEGSMHLFEGPAFPSILVGDNIYAREAWKHFSGLHEFQNLYLNTFNEIFPIDERDIYGGRLHSQTMQALEESEAEQSASEEPKIHPMTEAEHKESLKQTELDKRYLRMAFIWAENSHAKRRQVASFIVKDKMIVSDGYNGTPAGFSNQCEDENNETKPCVLHAEANAITKLAKFGNSCAGATIYITDEPCIDCAKLIIQSGIKRVVYCREYRIHAGIELLAEANIQVDHVELDDAPEVPCP